MHVDLQQLGSNFLLKISSVGHFNIAQPPRGELSTLQKAIIWLRLHTPYYTVLSRMDCLCTPTVWK